jgi:hypothetical protein
MSPERSVTHVSGTDNKDMVAREGLEPPPPAFSSAALWGGKLAAPFMLRSSYCRSKAITSLVFRKIYRVFPRSRNTVVPFCAYEHFGDWLQVPQKIWRPRRDLNPCYRRERVQFFPQFNNLA